MALPDEPITRVETFLADIAGDEQTLPVPVTRVEQYLAKIAGENIETPPEPITRIEQYLDYIAENGGGGVSPDDAVLIDKSISANGTYNASSDDADGYKKVTVDVPNTYAAGDEGKVVSNGALVSQTSGSTNQNGTVDTTLIDSLTVNVPQPSGTKQISISANGTTTEDVTAYASAEITVAVPVPTLTTLTATDNGTYTPTSGAAYNSVVVAIPLAENASFGGD